MNFQIIVCLDKFEFFNKVKYVRVTVVEHSSQFSGNFHNHSSFSLCLDLDRAKFD